MPHDIIFCGQRAIDDDSGQVGAMLAEALNAPQLTIVTKLEFAGSSVKVIRPIEGAQLSIETALPCVVTCQKGLNEPRYASLPGIMKAKKKPVDVKNAAAIGVATDAKATVAKTVPPPARPPGKIICGDEPAQKAAELGKLLREEAKAI
jgi:electron transfer flavoprotein beta subunit